MPNQCVTGHANPRQRPERPERSKTRERRAKAERARLGIGRPIPRTPLRLPQQRCELVRDHRSRVWRWWQVSLEGSRQVCERGFLRGRGGQAPTRAPQAQTRDRAVWAKLGSADQGHTRKQGRPDRRRHERKTGLQTGPGGARAGSRQTDRRENKKRGVLPIHQRADSGWVRVSQTVSSSFAPALWTTLRLPDLAVRPGFRTKLFHLLVELMQKIVSPQATKYVSERTMRHHKSLHKNVHSITSQELELQVHGRHVL